MTPSPPTAADDGVATTFRSVTSTLVERVDPLAEEIFAAMVRELPSSPTTTAAVLDDVRRSVRDSLRETLEQLSSGGPLTRLAPRFRRISAQRAKQGIALDEALLSYEIASGILLDAIVTRLPSDCPKHDAVITYAAHRMIEYVQVATSAVAGGYQLTAADVAATREREIQARLLIITGKNPDRAAPKLPPDPVITTPYRWCAVFARADGTKLVEQLRTQYPSSLIGIVDGRVTMFSAQRPTGVHAAARMGLAQVDAASETARAYDQARATAHVADHLDQPVLPAQSFAVLASLLAADPAERQAFIDTHLGAVLQHGAASILLDTLGAYLTHALVVAPAARACFVHRHTFESRLELITRLTNYDPRDAAERFLLEVALFLLGRHPAWKPE